VVAVPDHQPVSVLIDLAGVGVDVGRDLRRHLITGAGWLRRGSGVM
jgi:hypothetical protein